jgi:hypothetical protein
MILKKHNLFAFTNKIIIYSNLQPICHRGKTKSLYALTQNNISLNVHSVCVRAYLHLDQCVLARVALTCVTRVRVTAVLLALLDGLRSRS